jgi:endonuclease YncB( thermonuclease family)
VRLVGIDTPETKHPSKPVQCFGLEAAQRLTELIAGKSVKLVADTTQDDQDKYGRLLRYVYVDDVLVNKQMITEGFAFEYTYSIPYIFQSEFKQAQLLAQETSAGLWGAVCDYKAPTPLPTTYVCDCTKPCAQMSSCSEAQYQYSTCGCQDRDGDGDGLACNSICR